MRFFVLSLASICRTLRFVSMVDAVYQLKQRGLLPKLAYIGKRAGPEFVGLHSLYVRRMYRVCLLDWSEHRTVVCCTVLC